MTKKIVIDGRQSLYRVAVDSYSDPLKFISLLDYNEIGSPFIILPTVIEIPEAPPETGGVPSQPVGQGIGIVQKTITFPYTVTEESNGMSLTRFTKGRIESFTTGVGNKKSG